MWRATLKSLFARKVRLLLSTLSIVLGIAFVAGSFMFTNLLARSFDEIVQSTVGDVNVLPEGQGFSEMGSGPDEETDSLTADDVERVGGVDGVSRATGLVTSGQVYVLDTDGRLVSVQGAPGIASNWHDTPAAGGLEGARIVDGRAPERKGELVIDPGTLARSGHRLGDRVEVTTPLSGVQAFTLVGTATYGSGSTVGASYLFLTLPDAQRLFTEGKDEYTGIWVTTDQGADTAAVAKQIDRVLPKGWESSTGEKLAQQIEDLLDTGLGFVNTFLLVFAAIALLVATLLILNTFSILVAQRAREMAVLRAVGATRRQVRGSVLLEAFVIGVVGSTLGIAVGYGLVWGLLAWMGAAGFDLGNARPSLTLDAILWSYVIGIVITAVAAVVPAVRASRTRPVEALTDAETSEEPKGGGATTLVGIVCIEVAIAVLVCGLWLAVPGPVWWVGTGCALLLVGVVLAASLIGAPVLWAFGRLAKGLFGEIGRLAALNSKRQPGRTAATAATLMIGLALVTTVAVLAASTTASIRGALAEDQRGDFVVTPVGYAPFDARLVDKVEAVDGVDWVASFAPVTVRAEGSDDPVRAVGTTTRGFQEGSAATPVAGTMTGEADSAVISSTFAEDRDLSLGMTFTLTGAKGKQRFLVTGVADEAPGDVVVQRDTLAKVTEVKLVNHVVIFADAGADKAKLKQALVDATAEYKTTSVSDVDEYIQHNVDRFEQVIAMLYGLLGLALVISVLGIANTLSLSVIERTREIGLLRAVGTTRPQVRRMISLESVLVTVMGSLLGVGLGLLFGVVLQRVNADAGIDVLDVPWTQLLLFVVVAAVFGWVAAIGPARRAARLPVLDSISVE
ncbi:ABC transporter permease [uncultured Tessaracoccus sp.]|uniref:ABC transporter permease n=1 Tax=uncultured Tessaracoccus sp. TaxID=905023 RepID=UPI0025FB86D9|nr:ABC transporter permease [uncultured Tessaracoccus sp.]